MPSVPVRSLSVPRPAVVMISALALPLALLAGITLPAKASGPPRTTDVIVQLAGRPALAASGGGMRAAVADAHQQRLTSDRATVARIRDRGVRAEVTESYTYGFNGAAMTVPVADLEQLRTTPGVVGVFPDREVSAAIDPALSVTRVPEVWQRQDDAGDPTDGRGETVAILDTGIDYDHPDLGGGFGTGHKVVGGYDFVNDDADPMDDNGHGTHVAGIIAGSPASDGGITGVAPGATLTAYKVLDSNGFGNESTIMRGLEAAVSTANPHRADVVNMSLGSQAGVDDPLGQAARTAARSGVVVVAASGNDGPGEGTSSSPGNADGVVSVGASFSGVDLPSVSEVSPVRKDLRTQLLSGSANPPTGGATLPLVDIGNGSPDSYNGLDVAGKAVLMTYPTIFNYDAYLAAAASHGVAAVLLSTPDYFSKGTVPDQASALAVHPGANGDIGGYPFVAVQTDGTTATTLREQLAKGAVEVRIDGQDATDLLASFSSHGPAADTYLSKPDLVAPGVEIRSTWPNGKYQLDSGTSMAAPHVAGAAALLLQDHQDWTAANVSSSLASAAHQLDSYDPTSVGAGRLDVAASDSASVLPTPWSARLGLASMGERSTSSTTVTLDNVGTSTAHVKLRIDPATGNDANVAVSPGEAVIPAGRSRQLTVRAQGPDSTTSYDVSGWVTGTSTSREGTSRLRVPYLMAVRPLVLHPTPDPTAGPQTVEVYSEAPLTAAPVLSVKGPGGTSYDVTAQPVRDHWWLATLRSSGPAGTYHVSAAARSRSMRLTGAEQFTRLGSVGSARWDSVGPVGDAGTLVTSPDDPDVGYMLAGHLAGGLVQRTTDGGRTWQPVGAGVLDGGTNMAIATDPTDASTVYVAEDGQASQTFEGRVLVSHDRGGSWSTLPLPDTSYRDVEVSGDGRTIAVLDWSAQVHWSTDGGATWTTVGLPTTENAAAMSFSGPDLYVIAGAEVWKLPALGSGTAPAMVYTQPGQFPSLTSVAGRPGAVAVSGYDAAFQGVRTVAISTDGGSEWNSNSPSPTTVISSLGWVGDDLFAGTTGQSWQLPAGSATWSLVTGVPSGIRQFTRLGGHEVVSVSKVGVYRTLDGQTFDRIGTASTLVSTVGVSRGTGGESRLVVGTAYGNYSTPLPDGDVTPAVRDWGRNNKESAVGENETDLAVDPSDPRVVYEVRRNAFSRFDVLKSTDGGLTWTGVETVRTSAIPYQIAVSPANPSYVYVAEQDALGYGVLVSTDGGSSWRRYVADAPFTTVQPDPKDPKALWLGGPQGLYRSTDGGQTSTRLSRTPITSIAVDPDDRSHLVVAGASISTSSDGGQTLRPAELDGGRLQIGDLAFVGHHGVCAASASYIDSSGLQVGGRGVLCSSNGGRSWRNVSGTLPVLTMTGLAVSPDGRWVYAATSGQGVYRAAVRSLVP